MEVEKWKTVWHTASLPGLDRQWRPETCRQSHGARAGGGGRTAEEDTWEAVGMATDAALAGLSDGLMAAGGRTAGGWSWSDKKKREKRSPQSRPIKADSESLPDVLTKEEDGSKRRLKESGSTTDAATKDKIRWWMWENITVTKWKSLVEGKKEAV